MVLFGSDGEGGGGPGLVPPVDGAGGCAACVEQLDEDESAFLVDLVHDFSPPLGLLLGVDVSRSRICDASLRPR